MKYAAPMLGSLGPSLLCSEIIKKPKCLATSSVARVLVPVQYWHEQYQKIPIFSVLFLCPKKLAQGVGSRAAQFEAGQRRLHTQANMKDWERWEVFTENLNYFQNQKNIKGQKYKMMQLYEIAKAQTAHFCNIKLKACK